MIKKKETMLGFSNGVGKSPESKENEELNSVARIIHWFTCSNVAQLLCFG